MKNTIDEREPLSRYTTLRIGGRAKALFHASNAEDVISAARRASDAGFVWRVIGHGSNILASDDGVSCALIVYKNNAASNFGEDGLAEISGGVSLSDFVAECALRGLSGVENLAGIPGTVGGAIAGNAGAYGACIGDVLNSAAILTTTGEIKTVSSRELRFSYRHSFLKETGGALLSATLKLKPADPAELNCTINERLADRMKKHPDYKLVPTAGSWFKNPADKNGERIAAGKLLEDAGCKFLRKGGASVWPKHANIIVTDGRATAGNVKELANEMAARVQQKFGINLEWEVAYLE